MLNIGIIQAIFRLDDQFSAALNMIESRMTAFGRMGARWGNGFAAAGLALTTAITVPMGGLIKLTSDFETAFANVVKTVDGLDVDAFGKLNTQAQSLRDEIRGLAREIPVTHNELARIAAVGGQFGVPINQLTNFTEVVAKLGVAIDGIQPEIAAGALAQIGKIAKVEGSEGFERMASTLVDLGNKGTSTESTILEMTRRIAGAGATAGVSAQDMFGFAAATANLGHEAELGGTALSRTFLEISRAVAAGGDDLNNFAKVNRMSADQFKTAWGKDAMGTVQELIRNLGEIDKGKLPTVMAALFGKDVRQTQVLSTLIQDYKGFVKTMGDARTAWEQNTALAEEARKKFATFDNQLQLLKNRLADIGITVGGPIVNALRNMIAEMDPVIRKLEELAFKFQQLPEKTQAGIVGVSLFGSAIGPVLATVGAMVWGISQLGITFAGLAAVLKIGIYVALAAAVAYLVKQFLDASGVMHLVVRWGTELGKTLKELWDVIGRNMFNAVVETGGNFLEILTSLYNIITVLLQPFMELLGHENLMAFVMGTLKGAVGAVVLHFAAWLDMIRAVSDTISTALEKLEKFVRYIAQVRNIQLPQIPDRPGEFNRARTFQGDMAAGNIVAEGGMRDFRRYLGETAALNMTGAAMEFGTNVEKAMASPENAMRRNNEQLEIAAKKSKALSEAQQIAAEQARNLASAVEAQTNAFLEAYGGDHVQRALTLMQVQKDAAKAGLELPREVMREMADEVQAAMGVLANLKIPIPEEMYKVRDAANAATIDLTRLKDVGIETNFSEWSSSIESATENLFQWGQAINGSNWDKLILEQTHHSAKAILELAKDWDSAMEKFKKRPELGISAQQWRDQGRLIDQNYITKMEKVIQQTNEWRIALLALLPLHPGLAALFEGTFEAGSSEIVKTTRETYDLGKAVRQLSTVFSQLAEIKPLEGWIKDLAEIVALMAIGSRVGDQLAKVLTRETEIDDPDNPGQKIKKREFDLGTLKGDSGIGKALEAYIGLFSAGVEGYAAMQQATDVAGKRNRVMRGAMTGASIGSSFGPWGTVIGFVVGAIWGAVRKLQWEDIGKRIANRLNVDISEKLMRAIEATAKGLFGGDSKAAEVYHLSDIIKEAGGVTAANFDRLVFELRDVFVMLETSMFDAEQASKVLNDNWEHFIKVGTDGLGFISPKLKEIIALAEQFGVSSEKIAEWRRGQADSILEAFNSIGQMPESFKNYQAIADAIQEAKDELEQLNEEQDRGGEWAAKHKKAQDALTAALGRQQAAAAIAADELHDLGVIAVGSVFAAVAAGVSLTDAIAKAGPGLDSLIGAYKNLGMSAEDPLLKILLIQREVSNAIPHVVTGVSALGQAVVGLSNLNLLNADTFQSVQDTAFRAYTSIQGEVARAGGSTRDALLPMQTYLQQAERAARELGIPLDANTQMMIDQSKELGIWKALGPSAAELTQNAINNLTGAIDRLTRALLGIPDEIPDPTRNWGTPAPPPVPEPDPNEPPGPRPPSEDPGRAVGSKAASGNWFEQWDPAQPVRLHGIEAVVRPDQAPAFAADVMQGISADPFRSPASASTDRGPRYLVLPDGRVLAQLVLEEAPDEFVRNGIMSMRGQ